MSLADVELPGDLLQLALRWAHVLAAVLWIGFGFWLEWVWAAFVRGRPAHELRGGTLGLLSRTLFWLRWAALTTWVTGASLLLLLYYAGPYLLESGARPEPGEWLPALAAVLLGFVAYDLAFRWLARNALLELLLGVAWAASALGFGTWLEARGVTHRAIFVHVGAWLATAMVGNVWMRIWPARRRLLGAVHGGIVGEARDERIARMRARHNVLMSVPLVMLMLGADQPGLTGSGASWPWLIGGLLVIGASLAGMVYASLDGVGEGAASEWGED